MFGIDWHIWLAVGLWVGIIVLLFLIGRYVRKDRREAIQEIKNHPHSPIDDQGWEPMHYWRDHDTYYLVCRRPMTKKEKQIDRAVANIGDDTYHQEKEERITP